MADAVRQDIPPEHVWFLEQHGYEVPDIPPRVETPGPWEAPGAVFDPARAEKILNVFLSLTHTSGRLAGQPLRLDAWQVLWLVLPLAWVKVNEFGGYSRIVRNLVASVSRKAGKSTTAGGLAIYLAFADGEQGAQVVCAATTERQAGFVFNPVKQLAEKAPLLAPRVKVHQKKIVMPATASTIEVISSAADAQHGASIHGAIVDELHVHKSGDLLRTLETGTGARTQPLVVIITTADSGKQHTIYDDRVRYLDQLAARSFTDHSTYGVVWAADPEADPFAPETQRSANPGYGISPTAGYLEAAAQRARNSPAEFADYQRLHLGIRTKQDVRFLRLDAWDRNHGLLDEGGLTGRECYGGLDLAATSDLASFCLLFREPGGGFKALWRYWLPELMVPVLDKRTNGAMSSWVRDGWVQTTPGDVIDYDYIHAQITRDANRYRFRSIGFDSWNATQLSTELAGDGLPMVKVVQGFRTLSPALKELQRLILTGTEEAPMLIHGGNPVSRWCVDNLAVEMDAAQNVKPSKKLSHEKIDGVAALLDALSEAMAEKQVESAYSRPDSDLIIA